MNGTAGVDHARKCDEALVLVMLGQSRNKLRDSARKTEPDRGRGYTGSLSINLIYRAEKKSLYVVA